jgi:hypothetical protein
MALESKYDASDMVYPRDLLSNEARYGSNYVVFFVNVNDSDRPQTDQYGGRYAPSDFVPDFDPRVATSIQSVNATEGAAIAGAFTQTLPLGAGIGAIGALLRGNISGAAKGALSTAGIAAAPVAILKMNGVQFNRGKKRLKKTIMLHMPNEVRTNYSMTYGEVDLKNFALGAEIYNQVKQAGIKAFSKDNGTNLEGAGSIDELKKLLPSVANSFALSAPSTEGLQATTRLAPNPKKEILFNGVDFRSFQMNYQFFPKNEQEAKMVENIILMFKFHMHPNYADDRKFIFEYPSEFDISFYHGDTENSHLPKISSCALVAMGVDYSPNGVWGTNVDGSPIQINMALQFKELSILTKESIAKGY